MQTASLVSTVPAPARVRTRPDARLLGVHPLLAGLLCLQAAVLLFDLLSFRAAGLTFVAVNARGAVAGLLAVVGLWGYLAAYPGRNSREWVLAETFLTLALFLTLGALLGPAQYGGAALNRPYIDETLAAADAVIGVDVSTFAAWTRHHVLLAEILTRAYYTLHWQMFLPFLLLGFVFRDRRALWEYIALIHTAAVLTVICFALWPAACPPQHYGFEPVGIDQSRVYRHLAGLRSGTMTIVQAGDLDGLVSMPSFHVLGALCVTWVFRRRWWIAALLVVINALVTLATFATGVHYVIDVVASLALFPCIVWIYRRVEPSIEPGAVRQ